MPLHAKLTLFNCLIISLFDYEDTGWVDEKNNDTLMGQLQVLQNKAAKVLLNLLPRSSSTEALDRLDLKTLSKSRHFLHCVMTQEYLPGEIENVHFELILSCTQLIWMFIVFWETGSIFSSRTRIKTRTRLLYSDTNLNRIRIAAVGSDISNRNRARIVVKSGPI